MLTNSFVFRKEKDYFYLSTIMYAEEFGMMRYFKVGGLHFFRLGRLQVSTCLVRRRKPSRPSKGRVRLSKTHPSGEWCWAHLDGGMG